MRIIDGPIAVLNDGHPYLKQFPLAISACPAGGWVIRWVDFGTTSQETYFNDPVEASRHCAWMNRNAHIIEGWFGASLHECDVMWQGVAVREELREAKALVSAHERATRFGGRDMLT
jgi:hypothetical protein